MLAEQFAEHNLVVANDGSPTFFRPPCTFSAINVTAHSAEIPLSWRVAADTMGNSRGGIQRIRKPGPCPTANEVRRVVRQLEEHGHSISLQWVPSHVGLRGNEIVDRIALRAHDLSPTLRAPPDPRRYRQAIQDFFSDLSPGAAQSGHLACPTG
ncbi:hypothetical protein HPB47_005676 [Ixodes persulcatus]|uniref:Uncharacterized protein n=1 Tax=Ixodes persulcatus TaxID=34615 RepID=A0AC60PCQ1_IXOPE|nr:hypothetical protein HPB47_005676 [Ixodes persulcatus]